MKQQNSKWMLLVSALSAAATFLVQPLRSDVLEKSKQVNDTIVPSLGLTRLWRSNERGFQAIRITPAAAFETNREFTKRNVVYNQDF